MQWARPSRTRKGTMAVSMMVDAIGMMRRDAYGVPGAGALVRVCRRSSCGEISRQHHHPTSPRPQACRLHARQAMGRLAVRRRHRGHACRRLGEKCRRHQLLSCTNVMRRWSLVLQPPPDRGSRASLWLDSAIPSSPCRRSPRHAMGARSEQAPTYPVCSLVPLSTAETICSVTAANQCAHAARPLLGSSPPCSPFSPLPRRAPQAILREPCAGWVGSVAMLGALVHRELLIPPPLQIRRPPLLDPIYCSPAPRVHVKLRPSDIEESPQFSRTLAGKNGFRQRGNVCSPPARPRRIGRGLTVAQFCRRARHRRWTNWSGSSKAPQPDCMFEDLHNIEEQLLNSSRMAPRG